MSAHIDPATVFFSFFLLLIIASFTAYYANQKGKNPWLWFVIGLLIGMIAPLILLFIPSTKSQQSNDNSPSMIVSNPDPSLEHLSSPSLSEESLKRKEEEDKLWYYLDQNHQQMGPVSLIALRELWNRGQLELNSYVWTDGMEVWKKVDDLPELKDALSKHIIIKK